MPTPQRQMLEDFYVYETDFLAVAAGATVTNNIQIQADSNFRWEQGILFAANNAALTALTPATQLFPLATVLITDTGSGRQLSSGAMPIQNLFGSGQLPFILQKPKIFTARATIAITITSFDTAIVQQLRLSFIGTKLFIV
jgi:hypothetical protein